MNHQASQHFADASPFAATREFDTPAGRLQAYYRGSGIWSVFVLRDGAYVHDAVVRAAGEPEDIYDAWLEALDADDEADRG